MKLSLPGFEKYVDVSDQANDNKDVTILPEITINFELLSKVSTKSEIPSVLTSLGNKVIKFGNTSAKCSKGIKEFSVAAVTSLLIAVTSNAWFSTSSKSSLSLSLALPSPSSFLLHCYAGLVSQNTQMESFFLSFNILLCCLHLRQFD